MLRKKQEELMNHAGCLNLVTNTVLGTQVRATASLFPEFSEVFYSY